jgi:hypothetical protein
MAMMGSLGKSLGGANTSTMLSALNIEMGSLGRDMAAVTANVPVMLQSLQKSLSDVAGTTSATPAAAHMAGHVSQAVAKVVFVAVLNEAIDKASKSAHFNVETAINDLWIHLDTARKFSSGGGNAGPTASPSIDLETQKLKRMIQKRAQLFDLLGKIMERHNQLAKNVVQSMRG